MFRSAARWVLLIGLGALLTQPTSTQAQEIKATIDPRFVLEQTCQRLNAITNYQCTQLTNATTKELAYDSQGRGRIVETDNQGNTTSLIWDGSRTIEIREYLHPNGAVVCETSIIPGQHPDVDRGNVPWRYLGEILLKSLTNVLQHPTQPRIEPTEDGYCRWETGNISRIATIWTLDPKCRYVPIRQESFARGERHRCEDITFVEVAPGLWFPSTVRTQYRNRPPIPRLRFTGITVNDPDFDRLLTPDLPDGSTVADEVRGVRYVVDHRRGLTLSGRPSEQLGASATMTEESETTYDLSANQALNHFAVPSPSARQRLLAGNTEATDQLAQAAAANVIYVFQLDDADRPTVSHMGTGFLKLAEVLQYVCELGNSEYRGREDLLERRLMGDWFVRRNTSKAERLRSLEQLLHDETGLDITFEKRRVEAQVIRVTGIFQYHRLPGASGDNNVLLFAEPSVDECRTYDGYGSGTLTQLFRHVTNRTGMRFIDESLSSDMDLSWSDHSSSKLDPYGLREMFRFNLDHLIAHLSEQTGLTFTEERRKIAEWYLRVNP